MSDPGAPLNQFRRLSQHGDGREICRNKKKKMKLRNLVRVGRELWGEPFVSRGDKKHWGVAQTFPPFLGFTPGSSLSWTRTERWPVVWGRSCKNITVSLGRGDRVTRRRGLFQRACPKCLMNLQVNCGAGSGAATRCQHLPIAHCHTVSPCFVHA